MPRNIKYKNTIKIGDRSHRNRADRAHYTWVRRPICRLRCHSYHGPPRFRCSSTGNSADKVPECTFTSWYRAYWKLLRVPALIFLCATRVSQPPTILSTKTGPKQPGSQYTVQENGRRKFPIRTTSKWPLLQQWPSEAPARAARLYQLTH